MKIISYSDLHLEFGYNFRPPKDSDADVMILAGDIITFRNFKPLGWMLQEWHKPVLYVAGNHEYYTCRPMDAGALAFKEWLAAHHPNVRFLQDESVTINDVHFFGGTMWTDFNGMDRGAMTYAEQGMNDYSQIMLPNGQFLKPADTVAYHMSFTDDLKRWFENGLSGKRVVITHHAPAINPHTQHGESPYMPAYNSLDMLPIIEAYQPALWVYGHTHECDDQMIGNTRIISNQRGYPMFGSKHKATGFDKAGLMVEV